MAIGSQGEHLSPPRQEKRRPEMTHDRVDDALVASIVHGVDAARIVEGSKDDIAVLASATDILRLNNEAEALTPILAHQWAQQGQRSGRISTVIPRQRPRLLASRNAIATSLERGETLAGVIAAAGCLEAEKRARLGGVLRGMRQAVGREDQRLERIVRRHIVAAFGYEQGYISGAESAPLLWGRALQLLPHLKSVYANELLLPIGLGLEQSLSLNTNMFTHYTPELKIMAAKVTGARDKARIDGIDEDIVWDIKNSGMSEEDQAESLQAAQLETQREILKAALYGPNFLIPRPSRPSD